MDVTPYASIKIILYRANTQSAIAIPIERESTLNSEKITVAFFDFK